jgi:hypothetical protein
VDLYIYSPIRLHGVVLTLSADGTMNSASHITTSFAEKIVILNQAYTIL